MGIGDRIFWSVMSFIAISLLWLKFVDDFLPMWVSLFFSGGVIAVIQTHRKFRE